MVTRYNDSGARIELALFHRGYSVIGNISYDENEYL